MGAIFGGGGGGESKTRASSEYPAEFKPLAASSVKNIQSTQDALPLANFTSSQPQQIAGLSPFTVGGMELVPFTSQTTAPEQALHGMQPVWQDLMNRAVGLSQPSNAAQSSTDFLLGTLGIPSSGSRLSPAQNSPLPFMAPTSLPSSAFGQNAPMPIPPITEGVPSMPITPLMPTGPIAPLAAASGGAGGMSPMMQSLLTSQLLTNAGIDPGLASMGTMETMARLGIVPTGNDEAERIRQLQQHMANARGEPMSAP